MKIVVIGATGNVGTAVIRELRSRPGVEVVGVSRRRPRFSADPYAGLEWHAIDISTDAAALDLAQVIAGADAVINLAWMLQPNHDERAMWNTNVRGLANVLAAVAGAQVPHVVIASSVGTYSAGPKDARVDESWPTGGVTSSQYARQKSACEALLDVFEQRNEDVLVTRVRPGLVMHDVAGAELVRLFLGPVVPTAWLNHVTIPVLPLPASLVSQVVAASDLAVVFRLIVEQRAGGAFNVATEPVVSPSVVAEVLGSRWVPAPFGVLRALVAASWKLRLQRTDPGWLDLAAGIPVMSIERARNELGWMPLVDSYGAIADVVSGIADKRGVVGSPPLGR